MPPSPLELESIRVRVTFAGSSGEPGLVEVYPQRAPAEWDAWFDRLRAPGEYPWVVQRVEPEGDKAGARSTLRGITLEDAVALILSAERNRWPSSPVDEVLVTVEG